MYIQIEELSKALVFLDMSDIFQIIPPDTVASLELKLEELFTRQRALDDCDTVLSTSPINNTFLENQVAATSLTSLTTKTLQLVSLENSDLIKYFKDIRKSII